jgi:hypothetical protein
MSMTISDHVRDGDRGGEGVDSVHCGYRGDCPTPSLTPLLHPSSTGVSPAPAQMTPTGSAADPLHDTLTLTPSSVLAPGDLVTLYKERLFYPVSTSTYLPYSTNCNYRFRLLNACAVIGCKNSSCSCELKKEEL